MDDDRFRNNADRMRNRQTLLEIIDATTELESVDYWIEVINKAGCPCGRVMNLQEVFDDPQVRAMDMVLDVDHERERGRSDDRLPGETLEDACAHSTTGTELGEHNDRILGDS